MPEMTKELALALGLKQDGTGWVLGEAKELALVLDGGPSGPVSLKPVNRIESCADGWLVWIEENVETVWVRRESVVLMSAKRGSLTGRDKRTGFA